jgi:hypothetical protein
MSGDKLERPRRRMDRSELNAAARIIARRLRSRAVASKRQKQSEAAEAAPPERPEGYRQSVNIGFDASDLANLEKILTHMRRDPGLRALKADLGLAKATRYAIAKYAEQLS